MSSLDNLKNIQKIDRSDLADKIGQLPDQIISAWEKSQLIKINFNQKKIRKIIIGGMGGSAISGDLVQNLVQNQLKIPLAIVRGWDLPNWADQNTLIFLISCSGNTEETLSLAQQAKQRKSQVFVITSGGKLAKIASKKKWPCFKFRLNGPPRANLGNCLMPILSVLEKLKLIKTKDWQIEQVIKNLKEFNQNLEPKAKTENNLAKHLAFAVLDYIPIIIANNNLSGVARRWKTQFNENSKTFSYFELFPENLHNSVEAINPGVLQKNLFFLLFKRVNKIKRNKLAYTGLEKYLDKKLFCWEGIPVLSTNLFEQIMSLICLGDWISYYLAILNQVDPTPVDQIIKIKNTKLK